MLLPTDIFASIAQTQIVFPPAVSMLAKGLAIVGAPVSYTHLDVYKRQSGDGLYMRYDGQLCKKAVSGVKGNYITIIFWNPGERCV